jgi:hypothetical protein
VYATPVLRLEFRSVAVIADALDGISRFAEDRGMALEMRDLCERCRASLDPAADAFICSYECTFCPRCAEAMRFDCPNCGGELVRRPRRAARAESQR